jgi:hypothetical protein
MEYGFQWLIARALLFIIHWLIRTDYHRLMSQGWLDREIEGFRWEEKKEAAKLTEDINKWLKSTGGP